MAFIVYSWHLLCTHGIYCVLMAFIEYSWHLLCTHGIYSVLMAFICVLMAFIEYSWHLLSTHGIYCVLMKLFAYSWHLLMNVKARIEWPSNCTFNKFLSRKTFFYESQILMSNI